MLELERFTEPPLTQPTRRTAAGRILASTLMVLTLAGVVSARSVSSVPPLPKPTGRIVRVSTEAQLQQAVATLQSNTTIRVAPGTYRLTQTLSFNGTFSNITLRGETDHRDDVVILGAGMAKSGSGDTPYGIWTGGNIRNITVANLTLKGFYNHAIILNAGTFSPRIYNVRMIDAGQQFVKANPGPDGIGVPGGIVEYSIVEYTGTSRDHYTNGIDVHGGAGWIIRDNLFKNIRAPQGQMAGPAILMWNGSSNTLVEGNTFVNCQREISIGLVDRPASDHSGGVVRNNVIYRQPSLTGDAGILIADSSNTKVLHNSILLSGTYSNAIEYRFRGASALVIANNLSDARIAARDGASATTTGNLTTATATMFVDPTTGNLHLRPTAVAAIDKATMSADCPHDWDGELRPPSGPADLGADEYQSR